ncbi:MAG: hypothetical protein JXJ04_05515 [Spirochaetales bacterium]|nr:hypothetical protein [Spirochaetales bacterium]
MRTTIRIKDNLLLQAKKIALENHTTLSALVEEALQEKLLQIKHQYERKPVKIITFKGKGLQPGVDLDNSAALLEIME